MSVYERNCPKCNRIISHSSKKYRDFSVKKGRFCYSCAFKGRERPPEYRDKIRKSLLGRKLTEEHRNNIKEACKNVSLETRQKLSIIHKGKPSPRRGMTLTKEWRRKIRDGLLNMSLTLKQKVIDGNKQRVISDETRKKMRISRINYITKTKLLGSTMQPRFSIKACGYFDNLSTQNGWSLQHALNGGEYFVKDLGYWVDAYDKEKNVVVEYDEGYHNKTKEKDNRRMNEIKQHLGCKFFRYDAVSEELKEY